MRTRAESKRKNQSSGTLAEISGEAVGKLLRRVNAHGSSGMKKQEKYVRRCDSISMPESEPRKNDKEIVDTRVTWNAYEAEGCSRDVIENIPQDVDGESLQDGALSENGEEMDDSDWEDGSIPMPDSTDNHPNERIKEVTVEFSESPDSARRKPIRRASAEDKELAELVHKVHLLCLLARGRLIDNACDDPLIQASLLSLLPIHLLKISEVSKLTANALSPLVSWFHSNFHVRSSAHAERSFHSALAFALETREGTPEELAALSVALFRALKLTARFVSILDVTSLKPDADKDESSKDVGRVGKGIFNTSTLMVAGQKEVSTSLVKSFSCNEKDKACETSLRGSCKSNDNYSNINDTQSKDSPTADELNNRMLHQYDVTEACLTNKSLGIKRKGDLELEMQLEMAISATAVGTCESNIKSDVKNLNSNSLDVPSLKRTKRIQSVESSASRQGISTAVGSKKVGSPLHWAEIYCSGENLTGKWVHVDTVNAIIDGEQEVEAAAAACKTSLRYVVAFAGRGAKDVTRRYCMKWYRIASKRIESIWWDAVLAPLRELESGATGGMVHLEKHHVDASNEKAARMSDCPIQDGIPNHVNLAGKFDQDVSEEYGRKTDVESFSRHSFVPTRNSLEDMELETRALTEPLPTNQQAYKNHQLYAIERWLTKYQILHPKGPILGFCSGHPVYPRTCVQTVKTRERWLREGLQVIANELPVKVLKRNVKLKKVQISETDDYGEDDSKGIIELYGKWQLEPLRLPPAINGIVPKNERGQVDVWSEKCLPPGTVHLRLPRVFYVAKRLEIDYAPAMVGFEFRNGRSIPVFDGIVVCTEFRDAILEAYAEEEERREAEEKKRNEAQAISRWYQLLSSIVTRQKLNNCYGEGSLSRESSDIQKMNNNSNAQVDGSQDDRQSLGDKQDDKLDVPSVVLTEEHEHVFLKEDQSFDEESLVQTKRCRCGFSVEVEEL